MGRGGDAVLRDAAEYLRGRICGHGVGIQGGCRWHNRYVTGDEPRRDRMGAGARPSDFSEFGGARWLGGRHGADYAEFHRCWRRVYLYYGGVQGAHTGRKFATVERTEQPMLGLATLRRDGFASGEAGDEDGFLLTQLLAIERETLHVNAECRGGLRVEVTDDVGGPLEGYAAALGAGNYLDATLDFARPLADLVAKGQSLFLLVCSGPAHDLSKRLHKIPYLSKTSRGEAPAASSSRTVFSPSNFSIDSL